jgi:hypothetical protein
MPLPGLFSAYYWPGDGLVGAAPPPSNSYFIFPWFNQVNTGLPIPSLSPRAKKLLVRYGWEVWRYFPRRLQVTLMVLKRIWTKDFKYAREAVDYVSVSPELRDMKHWNSHLAERIGQDPHVHENVSRALAAYDKLPANWSRSDKMLYVELAWLGRKNG